MFLNTPKFNTTIVILIHMDVVETGAKKLSTWKDEFSLYFDKQLKYF